MAERSAVQRDLAEPGMGGLLHFGGDLNTINYHPVVNGESTAAANSILDETKEAVVPFAAVVRSLAFSSAASGTAVLTLFKNGVTTTHTWTLPGTTAGVILLDSSAEEAFAAGDLLAIRVTTANVATGDATFQVLLERFL